MVDQWLPVVVAGGGQRWRWSVVVVSGGDSLSMSMVVAGDDRWWSSEVRMVCGS